MFTRTPSIRCCAMREIQVHSFHPRKGSGEEARQIRLPRRGLTIVEMMVSLACVVILMLAYTQLFSDVGGRISDARSMIELETRMRSATNRLRTDLAAVTCDMMPWQRPEAGGGYFEIIEGSLQDTNTLNDPSIGKWPASVLPFDSHFLGDPDDTLMFTVRSKEGPFTGRYLPP